MDTDTDIDTDYGFVGMCEPINPGRPAVTDHHPVDQRELLDSSVGECLLWDEAS